MAIGQAEWNATAGVRSEFILLNPPCPESPKDGRDFVVVDPNSSNTKAQIFALKEMLERNGPRGPTPLAQRLKDLRLRLLRETPRGARIMLSIVTDGLPTSATSGTPGPQDSAQFIDELRAFAFALNAFLVIRLATDDDSVVEYYNKVDEELEFPLDILDDLRGEAQELRDAGNGWVTYTPMLHLIREGGSEEKLFDLLDERPFMLHEIAKFLELLLRRPHDPPFPREPKPLLEVAKMALTREQLVFDGLSGRMVPPVNIKLLTKALRLTPTARLRAMPGHMMRSMRFLLPSGK